MNPTLKSYKVVFERDLDRLKSELSLYKDEQNLWVVEGEIANSAGNLFLHLCGNLKHFIGAVLGNSGYVRQREKEFGDKGVSRADIDQNIDETLAVVSKTLEELDPAKLEEEYPIPVFHNKGVVVDTNTFILHLSGHLMYHIGQINYHRRLIDAR